jgi:hypothetical protein
MSYLKRSAVFPVALALVACAACGSSTSTPAAPTSAPSTSASVKADALTADTVVAAMTKAYQGASAVHIKGSMTQEGATVAVDLQLNKDSAGGSISEGGAEIPIRQVAGKYYMQYTPAVLKLAGLSATTAPGSLLKDKWVSSDSKIAGSAMDSFKEFFSYDAAVPSIVKPTGTLTDAGADTLNGAPVQKFRDSDGSTMSVSATAPHYPLHQTGPASSPGTLDFTGWDKPVPVVAPTAAELYSGPGA